MSRWDSLRDRHKTPRISLADQKIELAASTIDPMFQGSNMKVLDETTYTRIEFARQLALRGNFRTDLDGAPIGDSAAFIQLCRKLETHIGSIQTLNSLQIIKLANELDEHVRAAIYLCELADKALGDATAGLSHNTEARKAMIVALAKAVGSVCALAIPPPAGPLLGTIVVSVFTANSYTDMAGNLVGGILDAKTGAKKDTAVEIKGNKNKKLTATGAGTDATVGDSMGDKGGDILKACVTLLQDAGGMSETIKNSKVKTPLTYLSQRGSPPSETLNDFKGLKDNIEQMMRKSVQLIFTDLQELANQTTDNPKALAKALIDYESKVFSISGTTNLFLKNIGYETKNIKLRNDNAKHVHGKREQLTPPALQLSSVPTAKSRFFGFINNSAEVRAVEEANKSRREAHAQALLNHAEQTKINEESYRQRAAKTIVGVENRAIIEASATKLSDAAKLFINTRAAKMMSTIFARTGAIDTQKLQSREKEILKEFQIACVAAHFENIEATTSFNQAINTMFYYSTDDRFEELKDSVKLAAKDPANPQKYLMVAENFGGRTGRYLEDLGLLSRKPSTNENRVAGKNYVVSNLKTGPIPPIPYHSDKGKHSRVIMRAFAVEYTTVSHERLTKVIMG
jgi:hypothetical protein